MHDKGDLHFRGDGGVLGDETNLADHFQGMENVNGSAGDGRALGESVHGTAGPLDAQDGHGSVSHCGMLPNLSVTFCNNVTTALLGRMYVCIL